MTKLGQACFNDICQEWMASKPSAVPSETQLAERHDYSRTLIRKTLLELETKGILKYEGRKKVLLRLPKKCDLIEIYSDKLTQVELAYENIMNSFREGIYKAGDILCERQLALDLNTHTGTVREALLKIETYRFIEKQARKRWQVIQCNPQQISEALEFRSLIELKSLKKFTLLDSNHPLWDELETLKEQHLKILKQPKLQDWLKLDEAFHNTLVRAAENHHFNHATQALGLLIHLQVAHLRDDLNGIKESAQHHLDLIEFIKIRQYKKIETIFQQHMDLAYRRLCK